MQSHTVWVGGWWGDGGFAGIGAAFAREVVRGGGMAAIVDMDVRGGLALQSEIIRDTCSTRLVRFFKCDVTNKDKLKRVFELDLSVDLPRN